MARTQKNTLKNTKTRRRSRRNRHSEKKHYFFKPSEEQRADHRKFSHMNTSYTDAVLFVEVRAEGPFKYEDIAFTYKINKSSMVEYTSCCICAFLRQYFPQFCLTEPFLFVHNDMIISHGNYIICFVSFRKLYVKNPLDVPISGFFTDPLVFH